VLGLCSLTAAASCTGSSGLSGHGVRAIASQSCGGRDGSGLLQQVTHLDLSAVSAAVRGHLPSELPSGFGLEEVDRVDPGDGGFVAWTDAQCRRVNLRYTPGDASVAGPGIRAFGPWTELQRCGEPSPCLVWQLRVNDGLLTFSTWRLAPRTAEAVLRTVKIQQ
jgi:hypothetical protein